MIKKSKYIHSHNQRSQTIVIGLYYTSLIDIWKKKFSNYSVDIPRLTTDQFTVEHDYYHAAGSKSGDDLDNFSKIIGRYYL